VRWSNIEALTSSGTSISPAAVRVNYQAHAQGGCANTTVQRDGDGFLQVTNTGRAVAQGTRLPIG
jgi:hypothetical protein